VKRNPGAHEPCHGRYIFFGACPLFHCFAARSNSVLDQTVLRIVREITPCRSLITSSIRNICSICTCSASSQSQIFLARLLPLRFSPESVNVPVIAYRNDD
jgi:hypothetical protein